MRRDGGDRIWIRYGSRGDESRRFCHTLTVELLISLIEGVLQVVGAWSDSSQDGHQQSQATVRSSDRLKTLGG